MLKSYAKQLLQVESKSTVPTPSFHFEINRAGFAGAAH
jgi:hypothetical protein